MGRCRNRKLGLTTKARVYKVVGQEGSLRVASHAPRSAKECEGMNSHTPKWTSILRVGVPMDSQIFRRRFQGSKPIRLKSFLYHWKAIETKMFNMGLHHPFGHLKHKLWPKERPRVKLVVWFPTTKSRELTRFLACRWHATYHWKALGEGYNFALDLISIEGLQRKLWAPKVAKAPSLGISGLPLGSPKTKCHLNVSLMEKHKIYYKGEGGGFPKFGLWRVLWIRVCPWLILAPKMLKLCTNQLVVWFVQIHVSD
jgi:hypothetical protein